MNWLFARLREPSTIIALLAAGSAFFGLDLTPDQQVAVTMLSSEIFVSEC